MKKDNDTVKSPEPPKTEMRKFGAALEKTISEMGKEFKRGAIEALKKSTVEEFEDSSKMVFKVGLYDANFAAEYLTLAEKIRSRLVKRFSNKRIQQLVDEYTGKVDSRNKKEFYSRAEKAIGISSKELESRGKSLSETIRAYELETYQWVKKLRDDTLEQWTSQTLRLMSAGQTLPEILSQFDGMVETRRNHAKMVARTQIATFNSLTSKARARNLGITKAVWVTAGDERVRRCHQVRNGKEFSLEEGLYSSCDGKYLLPGVDYNCRCDYRMIIPPMEDE